MKKIKFMTIVGTRPELIRLSRIIDKLDKTTNHILVHTGQNYDYELNEIFFKDLRIRKPDFFLNIAKSSKNLANIIGNLLINIDKIFEKIKPEGILVLGDTNSSLSVLIAKRRKIPIFHMEAGNRCFDQRVPEEINRKIVDHVADINLTYSSIAREYLLKEGFPSDRIIKTGSPMNEVLNFHSKQIQNSKILKKLKIKPKNYFVVSSHREENIESKKHLLKLKILLNAIAEKYEYPIIFSTHPRTYARLSIKNTKFNSKIKFLKPFGYIDYMKLQSNALAVLSDSGTITEESSILNFPALNIRETHERPEGMEEASVMLVGLDTERVFQGLSILKIQSLSKKRILKIVSDYSTNNVSEKLPRIIHSYIDYVNRVVWKKY
tara:strand:+ start:7853 stop:8989 length:1137 start_codon:yes stop_codon:yes gene_type:complete